MSTTSSSLTISGVGIEVVYKDIKNLHIAVYPPLGRVRVAAPRRLTDDQVRLAVVRRLAWIKSQGETLRQAERQSQRMMSTGESHYVGGVRYRLQVKESPGPVGVEISGRRLVLQVPADTDARVRRAALDRWHRQLLRIAVPPLLAKWESRIDATPSKWGIRKMRTKWGSCNPRTAHIWLNVDLAQKHPDSLEYVLVHELLHLVEPRHNDHFRELLDLHYPKWQAVRAELNRAPLAHQDWAD